MTSSRSSAAGKDVVIIGDGPMALSPLVDKKTNKLVINKIIYHTALTRLQQGKKSIKDKIYKKEEFNVNISKIKILINRLSPASAEFAKSLEIQIQKLEEKSSNRVLRL